MFPDPFHTGSLFPEGILDLRRVHGGDINDAFCVTTAQHRFFLKMNDAARYPGMLEKEARALSYLASQTTLKIPAVVRCEIIHPYQFLVLEWLEPVPADGKQWDSLGRQLAGLHRRTGGCFGFAEDNYIGSLPQPNPPAETWAAFYGESRILPMVRMLFDLKAFDEKDIKQAESLCGRLDSIFPSAPPSLVHGDLWSGNLLFSGEGPALIDPALYFGHREMDLGMSLLFGGFDPAFYAAYEESYPLAEGWRARIKLTQLYPLLVHAVLFGGNYVARARDILSAH